LGLKAMKEMQELNTNKDTASNPMIMFLTLNASSLTLIPITIMVYRAQMGAANPSDIFIPLMIATTAATITALIYVCIRQKINLLNKVLLAFLFSIISLIVCLIVLFRSLPQEKISLFSGLITNFLLFGIIIGFIIAGIRKKVNVYDAFIEGAKDGFKTAIMIIPYLIAMLVGIALFPSAPACSRCRGGRYYKPYTIFYCH